jgi:tetratricopeptide (TPR) repeat protein
MLHRFCVPRGQESQFARISYQCVAKFPLMPIFSYFEQAVALATTAFARNRRAIALHTALAIAFTIGLIVHSASAATTDTPRANPGTTVADKEIERKLFDVSELLLKDPQNPTLQIQKGVFLAQLERFQAASEVFEALRQQYPNQPAPYANLASIYARMGRLEEARQMLLKADSLQADRYQTQLGLATVNLELALQALNTALDMKPGDATTLARRHALARLMENPLGVNPGADASPATLPGNKKRSGIAPQASSHREPERGVGALPAAPRTQPKRDRLTLDDDFASTAQPTLPATTSQGGKPGGNENAEELAVRSALDTWSKAWSQKSFDSFEAQYSGSFQPANDLNRDTWAAKKRRLLESAKYIHVDVVIEDVQVSNGLATVRLKQKYRSNRYSDRTRKELTLKLEDGNWRITSEKYIR